jgi:hypothetical protein
VTQPPGWGQQKEHVKAFVQAIGTIHGAARVTSKLDAYTFTPDTTATAKQQILDALEQLISAAAGDQ